LCLYKQRCNILLEIMDITSCTHYVLYSQLKRTHTILANASELDEKLCVWSFGKCLRNFDTHSIHSADYYNVCVDELCLSRILDAHP